MEKWNRKLKPQSIEGVTFERAVINMAGRAFGAALNSSEEINRAIEITPKAGFDLKLELISGAEDMSTQEKLDAIAVAEDKYSEDIATNARTCQESGWSHVGLALLSFAGMALIAVTPGGRRVTETVMKLIA